MAAGMPIDTSPHTAGLSPIELCGSACAGAGDGTLWAKGMNTVMVMVIALSVTSTALVGMPSPTARLRPAHALRRPPITLTAQQDDTSVEEDWSAFDAWMERSPDEEPKVASSLAEARRAALLGGNQGTAHEWRAVSDGGPHSPFFAVGSFDSIGASAALIANLRERLSVERPTVAGAAAYGSVLQGGSTCGRPVPGWSGDL